jgi:hypothetical protein
MPTETNHAPPLLPDYPHEIKLVVCDLDGTLVQPDLKVNDIVLEAIESLHLKGEGVRRFFLFEELSIHLPLLGCGGFF